MQFDVHYTISDTGEDKKATIEAKNPNTAVLHLRRTNAGTRLKIRKVKAKRN